MPQRVVAQPAYEGQPLASRDEQYQADDGVVVAQPSLDDRSRQGQRHQGQERALYQHQEPGGQGQEPTCPAQQPEQEQSLQRSATETRDATPVLHRREQEAGDYGHSEAKQHFVTVPGEHSAGRFELVYADEHAGPQQQGNQGEQAAAEEEGSKTQGPESLAGAGGDRLDEHGEDLGSIEMVEWGTITNHASVQKP
ncbi:hypothetical protein EMIT047CA2_50054 [Pseudomonas soli]